MKKNKLLLWGIVATMLLGTLTGCEDLDELDELLDDTEVSSTGKGESGEYGFGKLGSASELYGRTVVLSIFADDDNSCWSEDDVELMYNSLDSLGVACDWITENAAKYGSDAEFIYDWEEDDELYYTVDMEMDLIEETDDTNDEIQSRIDGMIDSDSILEKYDADNIIYFFLVNTPSSNTATSCTANYYEGMNYPYEFCLIYMNVDGEEEGPAAMAHEMLHTFGAPDFYMADEDGYNYGTTKKMVKYLQKHNSNDIMFTCFDAETQETYYDHISNDFTEADAYYVGLTDKSKFAKKWKLEPSQHE